MSKQLDKLAVWCDAYKKRRSKEEMGLQTDIDSIEASLRQFETKTFDRLTEMCKARPVLRNCLDEIITGVNESAVVGELFIAYALDKLSDDILKVAKTELLKRINEECDKRKSEIEEIQNEKQ